MKKLIVMMGGQGVGKGTFSRMLADKYGFRHVETGAMLRSAPADSDIAKTIARGELVPDEMLFDLIASQIGNGDVILDGFPRTISQAKWLIQNFAGKLDIRVIYLEVPEDIMITRINKRIKDGGGRADDADMVAVRRRLDTFWNVTVPAINWLRDESGVNFKSVSPMDAGADRNFLLVEFALK